MRMSGCCWMWSKGTSACSSGELQGLSWGEERGGGSSLLGQRIQGTLVSILLVVLVRCIWRVHCCCAAECAFEQAMPCLRSADRLSLIVWHAALIHPPP
jgi:hypothetical protein